MSIIQEALKKAQADQGASASRPLPPRHKEGVTVPPSATGAPSAKKPVAPKKVLAVVPVVLLVAAIALVSYFLWPRVADRARPGAAVPDPAQEVSYRPLPGSVAQDTALAGEPEAADRKTDYAGTTPTLILNGIMYLEEGPRAIINNAIVETGDSVGGARVERIERKKVILIYNDVEITLNLK